MAAAEERVVGAAPAGYTGEGTRDREGGRARGGGGVCNRCVARSSGGEVRGAAALAPLPSGEGAPGAGGGRQRAPASPHPLRPQRPPVLQRGEWGWGGRLEAEGIASGEGAGGEGARRGWLRAEGPGRAETPPVRPAARA